MSQGQETRIKGNVGKDGVELRYTPSGAAVANFSVAHTKRRQVNGNWEDGEPVWLQVTVWNEKAENAAASLEKGTEVVVIGELNTRKWTDRKTGEPRSAIELVADSISVSLDKVTVAITKNAPKQRNDGGGNAGNNGNNRPASNNQQGNYNAPAPEEAAQDDEPPF